AETAPPGWKAEVAHAAEQHLTWDACGDPVLEGLIERALTDRLDMESARQRLESAQLSVQAIHASALPRVSISDGVSAGGDWRGSHSSRWSASPGASYEVDLWGRRAQRIELAEIGLDGAEIALQVARISVAA